MPRTTYSVKQVGDLLNLNRRTILYLIQAGKLKPCNNQYRTGTQAYKISKTELDRYMAERFEEWIDEEGATERTKTYKKNKIRRPKRQPVNAALELDKSLVWSSDTFNNRLELLQDSARKMFGPNAVVDVNIRVG